MLYLTEAVDEYCIQSLPEFEGKKFQNVAKEGLKIDQSEKAKEYKEQLEKDYEPLLKWFKDTALADKVSLFIFQLQGINTISTLNDSWKKACRKHGGGWGKKKPSRKHAGIFSFSHNVFHPTKYRKNLLNYI